MIDDDTRERFLRAIAERLDAQRVEEVHLFPALRQGGVESAVAVIGVHPAPEQEPVAPERLIVYRAHYRWVRKGPDRGTWEVGIIEEADAPPITVGKVVRGVHERSGGDDEPERLGGEAFRAIVVGEPWTAAD